MEKSQPFCSMHRVELNDRFPPPPFAQLFALKIVTPPHPRARGDCAPAHAPRLQWVAVLFVIFQTPSIRSNAWKSPHERDGSAGLSNPRRTLATSPACVTEMKRPTMGLLVAAHLSKQSVRRSLWSTPS